MSRQLRITSASETPTYDRMFNRRCLRFGPWLIACCLITLTLAQFAKALPPSGQSSAVGMHEITGAVVKINDQPTVGVNEMINVGAAQEVTIDTAKSSGGSVPLPYPNLVQGDRANNHQAKRDGTISIKGKDITVHATAVDWSKHEASFDVKIEGKNMSRPWSRNVSKSNGNGTAAAQPLHPGVYVQEIATGRRNSATRVPGAVSVMTIPRGSIPAKPSAAPARSVPYSNFNFKVSIGR